MRKPGSKEGATGVEYGLMASIVAGVIVFTVIEFGPRVSDLFLAGCAAFPGPGC